MRILDQKYQSFILRLWQTDQDSSSSWHALLEDTATCERIGFASVEQLTTYLEKQTQREQALPEIITQ